MVVTSFLPNQAACDGLSRSFYGLFDGHNGARAAETAASRLHTLLAAGELPPPPLCLALTAEPTCSLTHARVRSMSSTALRCSAN